MKEPPVEPIAISGEARCQSCVLSLVPTATIGTPEPPGALTDQAIINVGPDNRYYVFDVIAAPGQVIVYDSIGQYFTTFGRQGEGPGEFTDPIVLLTRQPDTIQIFDLNLRRLTTFAASSYEVVRTESSPLVIAPYAGRAMLPDGRFIVNGSLRTRSAVGYPLHVLGDSLRVLRSFGSEDPSLIPGRAILNRRFLAPAGDGHFWASRVNRLEVELWDTAGHLLQRITRDADWFEPWDSPVLAAPWYQPPQPQVISISEAGDGMLWLAAIVPDANWQPTEGPGPSKRLPDHLENPPPEQEDQFYDTVVEVWDPVNGEVVTSTRFDRYMYGFLQGRMLYSVRESERGRMFYDVWKVVTTQTQSQGGAR